MTLLEEEVKFPTIIVLLQELFRALTEFLNWLLGKR